MKTMRLYGLLVSVCLMCGINTYANENWQRVLNLQGYWKFTIGDNSRWADPVYNDQSWEKVYVPASWEDQGFHGYDGYAWYRFSFDGSMLKNRDWAYNLFLGYVDDVDEVYLNGKKIGFSGSFPPRYLTAYNAFRNYLIPQELINFSGKNVIAVRVFDAQIAGGIVSGDVGIYTNPDDRALAVNLRGIWDFQLAEKRHADVYFDGNFFTRLELSVKQTYKEKGSADVEMKRPNGVHTGQGEWTTLLVPGVWEHQGYRSYDGSAWYRKEFVIPKELDGEDLVLMLGKIDDYDQTYLNGKLVGSTNWYDRLRIYALSPEIYKAGETNILHIYVEDPGGFGGFSEGPVGIMKQSDATRFLRWR